MEKSASGKKGTCINCERKKFIADKFGHCNACHNAVKGLEPGTSEYTSALAEAKARLTDPKSNRGGKSKTKPTSKNPEYEKYVYQCRERGDVPLSYLDWSNKPLKPSRRSVRKVKALAPVKGKPAVSKRKLKSTVMPTASDFKKFKSIESQMCGYMVVDGDIIKRVTVMRDYCQNQANKLTQAIELMQS